MGIYLNPGADAFLEAVRSEIYVDKTGLIQELNRVLGTQQKYVCVSRPRRFGKTMAANMVCAYYDRTVDPRVFDGLRISEGDGLDRQGGYDVLRLNMQEFVSRTSSMGELLALVKKSVLWDLLGEYPEVRYFDDADMIRSIQDVAMSSRRRFVIVIDEWDCIFREYPHDDAAQRRYLDFLRDWLKDKTYVALAYMTGILPIKKYGTHSALNMFDEYSMENPRELAEFVGFTEGEVSALCERYRMSFEECRHWYDGYHFDACGDVYSPRSIVSAMLSGVFDDYWNRTETYEALKVYIDMNFDGLRDAIIAMMAGDRVRIDTRSFQNDMTTFNVADDVMTLLVHLGYLGYDFATKTAFVPNQEVLSEFVTATTVSRWPAVVDSVQESARLLQSTWDEDEQAVAAGIERAHLETSHIQYNDENALSYTVSLAYYAAREYYNVVRELPSGKGFADLVFLPRPKHLDRPALVVELKWDKDAQTTIRQIEERGYTKALEGYVGDVLLVGVSYDRKTRHHACRIRRVCLG